MALSEDSTHTTHVPHMTTPFAKLLQSQPMLALGFGLLIGALGLLTYSLPGGFALEEDVALKFLFHQRPDSTPPGEVVLVSIDKSASDQLDLPNDPDQWPRDLHARLIDKLSAAGARLIVFDIFFHQARPGGQDRRLAEAMGAAGNVLIFSRLQREVQPLAAGTGYNLERLVTPLEAFHQAAAATAPFVLPKVPVRVSQFWSFHPSAGGLPSLPAVALEHYAAHQHGALINTLVQLDPHAATTLQASLADAAPSIRVARVREFLRHHPALAKRALASLDRRGQDPSTRALLALYLGPERHYLNFYGPPRTIPTTAYHQVLGASAQALAPFRGKVVFVGFAEQRQPEQKDSFYTVFSQASGLDLSGVEIAATAFANLLARETLRLPGPLAYIALIFGYGLLLAGLAALPGTRLFVALSLLAAALYTLLCLTLFTHWALWLPLFVPVLVQTPAALFIGLLWRHRNLKQERRRIRRAFGYYLPDHVIDDLARDTQPPGKHSERMFGVCLASDAAQYTRLAESMSPEQLSVYMNDYYQRLFRPVRAHGGVISDVVGDAMLAIWSARQPQSELRDQACRAALETLRADQAPTPGPELHTRIGLHAGDILLGHVGALDHYEYRALGDIVNTATRIEGLNKALGTRLLASDAVLSGLEGFISRELGTFRLVGKQQALVIHELLALRDEGDTIMARLCETFALGLGHYQRRDCAAAIRQFQAALAIRPEDGPSRYYLTRCELHQGHDLPWPDEGVIVMPTK
mgnify:CR=1 FL=1